MKTITIKVNGESICVAADITVAAVLANNHKMPWRHSVTGQLRAPLCGMGVCFECRVCIDGVKQRACQIVVKNGMEISCDD